MQCCGRRLCRECIQQIQDGCCLCCASRRRDMGATSEVGELHRITRVYGWRLRGAAGIIEALLPEKALALAALATNTARSLAAMATPFRKKHMSINMLRSRRPRSQVLIAQALSECRTCWRSYASLMLSWPAWLRPAKTVAPRASSWSGRFIPDGSAQQPNTP